MAGPPDRSEGWSDDGSDDWARDWADYHDDDTPPSWAAGQHLPPDALRMGLTSHVPDGALLDFAGSLDSSKLRHRITAWVMLVVFGMPVLFHVLRLVHEVL